MSDDVRYEVALLAARRLIGELNATPWMPRHERLARVTYAMLDAIYAAEERLAVSATPPAR